MNLTQLDTAVDHVIIGLDYGTTGTAIWIMIVPRGKSIEESSHYLTNWPSSNETRVDAIKVPSRIAFPVDNPSFSMRSTHWGFGINPGMNSYFWTKLLLEEHTGLGEFDDEVLMSTALKGDLHPAFRSVDCQDPEKVILDYLGHVLEFTRGHLKERPDINFDFASVHLQFTTPASWSKKAQELSEWAVKRAWWFRRNHDTLTVLSEPEAASKAICQSLQGEFKTGDGILICDCGGGTVDITTYLVTNSTPISLSRISSREGAKCGGVAIDNRLFSLMKKHMPDAFGHLNHLIAPGSIFMDSFEKLKRDFDEGLPYHCFKLPLQVRRGRATCDPRYYNSSAFEFYLRYDDIKVANLEYGSPVINKIVLVGGLGSSTYVQRVIRQALESSQKLCVMVPMAIDPIMAVSYGSALHGLHGLQELQGVHGLHENHPARLEIPEHYGLASPQNLNTGCLNGQSNGKRIDWIVHKGHGTYPQGGSYDWKYSKFFREDEPRMIFVPVYSCGQEKPPDTVEPDDVALVGFIPASLLSLDLTQFGYRVIGGRIFYELEIWIRCIFDAQNRELHFSAWASQELIGEWSFRMRF